MTAARFLGGCSLVGLALAQPQSLEAEQPRDVERAPAVEQALEAWRAPEVMKGPGGMQVRGVRQAPGVRRAGDGTPVPPWGYRGHEMATRAAVDILPETVPAFFREAVEQLAYLSPEPDRWRISAFPEMDRAGDYDHYVDLENLPEGALDAADRFAYLRVLFDAGVTPREGGLLLFRVVELHQRLASLWDRWHGETDPRRRRFIEARIVDDAGLLGHYVTDASQPHHTTIHFNGWDRDAPNPENYSTERGFHSRFETTFVNAHISVDDIAARMPDEPRSLPAPVRGEVLDFIMASHAEVETLYRLDRDVGFSAGGPPAPEAKAFAASRLAAGSEMLASLWWSAFVHGRSGR